MLPAGSRDSWLKSCKSSFFDIRAGIPTLEPLRHWIRAIDPLAVMSRLRLEGAKRCRSTHAHLSRDSEVTPTQEQLRLAAPRLDHARSFLSDSLGIPYVSHPMLLGTRRGFPTGFTFPYRAQTIGFRTAKGKTPLFPVAGPRD
jgi:hypothetical protein